MEFLGVGPSELIFIILIAIIILGPKDMQKAGRTIGRFLNQLIRSDSWKIFQQTSNELRNLPRNLMREANMEMMEAEKDLRRVIDPRTSSSPNRPSSGSSAAPANETEKSPAEPPINPTETNPDENA